MNKEQVQKERKQAADLMRELAKELESDTAERIVFEVKAKRYPVITKEMIKKQDEAARQGWVMDIGAPMTLTVHFDGTRIK